MLVLGAVIFAALLTAAVLTASGPRPVSLGTACPSPSISQQADAGRR
jgi:hypothetical protein